MRQLSNNSELYQYLVALEAILRKHGAVDLADTIGGASRLASGLSTEFLGESRIALRRVSAQRHSGLTEQERRDLLDVLKQLDAAFDRR